MVLLINNYLLALVLVRPKSAHVLYLY